MIGLGFLIRLLFYFFGAEIYYGKAEFYIGGDTYSFLYPIRNLIEHGVYSTDLKHPNAVVGRLPGYPFFLAPFYGLFGETEGMFRSIALLQVLIDSASIWLIFQISMRSFSSFRLSIITALLYATYPFVVVWTSIVYAETLGMFLLLLLIYSVVKYQFSRPLLTGILSAIAFFVRPQLLFLLPALFFVLLLCYRPFFLRRSLLLLAGFTLVYAWWPIRNYVNHDKVEFMRDITSMRTWQEDVLYFHKYVNGLQAGWEPQMTQLIQFKEMSFPSEAYALKTDSALLEKAIHLSRTCSDGFASFMGKAVITEGNCTDETAALWKELLHHQMKENSWNYFVNVPLQGIKKGIFKLHLVENWKSQKKAGLELFFISSLFIWRTLLILLGLLGGLYFLRKEGKNPLVIIALTYFVVWYGWLCVITRYLEIRYLLPADVLLLFPSAYLIHLLLFRKERTASFGESSQP